MSGYLQLDGIQDAGATASQDAKAFIIFVVIGFVVGTVWAFFRKDRTPGRVAEIMMICLITSVTIYGLGLGMTGVGQRQQESDDYTSNISRFEKAYGVKTDSFIPKDRGKDSLGNLVGAADYGTREYMYLYDDDSQTVTINIDKKGRLRMISDGKVVPPSSHHHAGKLE